MIYSVVITLIAAFSIFIIYKKNSQIQSLQSKLDDRSLEIKSLNSNLKEYSFEIEKIKNDSRLLTAEFVKIKSELTQQIHDDEQQIKILKDELAFFTEIHSDSKRLNTEDTYKENVVNSDFELELDNEQAAVFDVMNNSNSNMFVTGKAGTGKSFLLKHFVNKTIKNVLVLAPTGIAALNAGGVTIHSAFGWNNLSSLNIDDITTNNLKLKSEKRIVLKNVQTIIIDEISMVRSDLLEKIDRILKIVNKNDFPFGNKQIILFGDLFQLPPIADKEEIKYLKDTFGGKYFFYANAFKDGKFKFFELSTNHRQKDDQIYFSILNNIREGKILNSDLTKLNSRTKFNDRELQRIVRLFPKKEQVEKINQKELEHILAKEYTYKCDFSFDKNNKSDKNFNIEKNMPIAETLKLKLGALVMMVTNDENRRWVNGTLGIVSKISEKCIKVMINGYEHEIFQTKFTQNESVYEDGKIVYKPIFEVHQYPIILAYAITIHKSQGMTYQKIACDVSNCFEAGQVYVALSRCTSLDGLYLLKKVDKKILGVESDVLDFYNQQKSSVI